MELPEKMNAIDALKEFYDALEEFASNNFEGPLGQLREIVEAHKSGIDELKTEEELKAFLLDTIDGQSGTQRMQFIRAFNAKDNGIGLFQAIGGHKNSLTEMSEDYELLSTTERMITQAYMAHLAVGKVMPVISEIKNWQKNDDTEAYEKTVGRLKQNPDGLDKKALGQRFNQLQEQIRTGNDLHDRVPETVSVPGRRGEEWSLAGLIDHAKGVIHDDNDNSVNYVGLDRW